jgi:hypothetical protein
MLHLCCHKGVQDRQLGFFCDGPWLCCSLESEVQIKEGFSETQQGAVASLASPSVKWGSNMLGALQRIGGKVP